MAFISLRPFAQILGSNTVSGMAQKAGLKWPPPPPVSIRNLANLTGKPLQPTNLRAEPVGNPMDGWYLTWDDPASTSGIAFDPRTEIGVNFTITNLITGKGVTPYFDSIFNWTNYEHDTPYSLQVTPYNQFGQGPISAVYTFRTEPGPPGSSWILFLQAGPVPVYLDTLKIDIDQVTWTVTPEWNSALVKSFTVTTPSAGAMTGSLKLPIPTGSVKTVTVSISGKASTTGGTVDFYSVPKQSFLISSDTQKVAFYGPDEHIGWSLVPTGNLDKDNNLIFTASPIWAGTKP